VVIHLTEHREPIGQIDERGDDPTPQQAGEWAKRGIYSTASLKNYGRLQNM
jgi:hypothetical protein